MSQGTDKPGQPPGWATEEEVERCAIVVDMEYIDGKWTRTGSRPGKLYDPKLAQSQQSEQDGTRH